MQLAQLTALKELTLDDNALTGTTSRCWCTGKTTRNTLNALEAMSVVSVVMGVQYKCLCCVWGFCTVVADVWLTNFVLPGKV